MELIFSIAILIMSVVIHEVSHGYAAALQGDPTAKYQGRLTLNPIKHLDPMGSIIVPLITAQFGIAFGWAKPVPFNPYNLRNQRWGELIVAIAGPLSNLLIALVFGTIIRFGLHSLPTSFINFSVLVVIVNLGLAIFNLVPVPPLDGSKVLFAFLPYQWRDIRRKIEQYGFILVLLLIMIPQFSEFLGMIVRYLFTIVTGVTLAM
jgi:Zn-dependent protease